MTTGCGCGSETGCGSGSDAGCTSGCGCGSGWGAGAGSGFGVSTTAGSSTFFSSTAFPLLSLFLSRSRSTVQFVQINLAYRLELRTCVFRNNRLNLFGLRFLLRFPIAVNRHGRLVAVLALTFLAETLRLYLKVLICTKLLLSSSNCSSVIFVFGFASTVNPFFCRNSTAVVIPTFKSLVTLFNLIVINFSIYDLTIYDLRLIILGAERLTFTIKL